MNDLTPREKAVIVLSAKGMTTRQIAEKWGIRWESVRTYKQNLREKLEAHNMVEAVAKYLRGELSIDG